MIFGQRGRIDVINLERNIGILPVKMGTVKLKEYSHNLIHYYDLKILDNEVKKLEIKTNEIKDLLNQNYQNINETSNHFKVINMIKENVETKLSEILPQTRQKRGLINGIGSIFKSITGNLDADDGIRYDKLIQQLRDNQVKITGSMKIQSSLSVKLIDEFKIKIQKISNNQNILQERINQITKVIKESNLEVIVLKDTLARIINIYEIVLSILQDIENSISFAKLGIIHPSIIKPNDLLNELTLLSKYYNPNQIPIQIKSDHLESIMKILKLKCFIYKNQITYIINVPITFVEDFELFRLYPVPIPTSVEGQFKVIIPKSKFIAKNRLDFSFLNAPCIKLNDQQYFCTSEIIESIQKNNPCEIESINNGNISICKPLLVHPSNILIQRLEHTNQWIFIIRHQQNIRLTCHQQDEVKVLKGSFLITIPFGCRVTSDSKRVVNQDFISSSSQPMLFPRLDLSFGKNLQKTPVQIENIALEDLSELKWNYENSIPAVKDIIDYKPSVLSLIILGLLIFACFLFLFQKFITTKKQQPSAIELSSIQLP